MTSIADETALWSRARSRDGRAFAALFDAHRDRAFRHTLRLVASTHDAEDVVAAAFFELWRKRDTVPIVDGSVLPWLLATTTNLARNSGRGLRRYSAAIDRLPRSEDLTDPAAPGTSLARARGAGAPATGTYRDPGLNVSFTMTCRGTGWLEVSTGDGGTTTRGNACSTTQPSTVGFGGVKDTKPQAWSVIPHGDISWTFQLATDDRESVVKKLLRS